MKTKTVPQVVFHKFVPGRCRLCGARPRVIGQWVTCSDAQCNNGTHPAPRVTWPRVQVIDWHRSWPNMVAVGIGGVAGSAILYALIFVALGV